MKIDSSQLLSELTNLVNSHMSYTDTLKDISEQQLNSKVNAESWSALECIEHLNLVMKFYVPELDRRIRSSNFQKSDTFRGTYLGNKFAKSMLPNDKMRKVKTFKRVNPISSELTKSEVIHTFEVYLKQLLELLEMARETNLTKVKTSTLISILKLRLGNTLQLVIYHNERHIVQAQKTLRLLNDK